MRFAEGRVYRLYTADGAEVRCVRRWFEGALEMVDMVYADGTSPPYVRTAQAVGSVVFPRITESLGGVMRPDLCDHARFSRVLADAGPFAGRECCSACGAPPDETLDSDAMRAAVAAVEMRGKHAR